MFDKNKYVTFTSSLSHSNSSVRSNDNGSSQELAQCQSKLTEVQEKFVRTAADFENYKRRMQREQAQWLDVGATRVLTQLLAIADDFDRALASIRATSGQAAFTLPSEVASWLAGFELIHKSLQKMLESCDVREIPHNLPFDPERHEAIVSVESSGHASGDIVEIVQKGYTYKDKVLRPAQVSVAK